MIILWYYTKVFKDYEKQIRLYLMSKLKFAERMRKKKVALHK